MKNLSTTLELLGEWQVPRRQGVHSHLLLHQLQTQIMYSVRTAADDLMNTLLRGICHFVKSRKVVWRVHLRQNQEVWQSEHSINRLFLGRRHQLALPHLHHQQEKPDKLPLQKQNPIWIFLLLVKALVMAADNHLPLPVLEENRCLMQAQCQHVKDVAHHHSRGVNN